MKEDKVVYAMALLAVLSVAGLLLFELALSPKARLSADGHPCPAGAAGPAKGRRSSRERVCWFPMERNRVPSDEYQSGHRRGSDGGGPDWGEARTGHPGLHCSARGISDMDELLEIEGIGEATLAGLKELFYAE